MPDKCVIQVPPGVDVRDLPEEMKIGVAFPVGSRSYVCEESVCPGLALADAASEYATAVPEDVARFLVVRRFY